MLPAHQPLRGHGLALTEFHLRLVVEHELVVGQGPAQVGGQTEPLGAVVVVLGAVDDQRVVVGLGAIHGHVGALEQRVDVAAVLGVPGQADAGVQRDADPVHVDRLGQRVLQALHRRLSGGRVSARHEYRELVPAEAGDEVLAAEGGAQPRADLLQDEVAVMVSERVVDVLEAVEVDQQQAARFQRRGPERGADRLHEPAPVGQRAPTSNLWMLGAPRRASPCHFPEQQSGGSMAREPVRLQAA